MATTNNALLLRRKGGDITGAPGLGRGPLVWDGDLWSGLTPGLVKPLPPAPPAAMSGEWAPRTLVPPGATLPPGVRGPAVRPDPR